MPKMNEKVIVVIGDRGVGKSCLIKRLVEEPCNFDDYKPTIDECYYTVWKLPDKKCIQIQLIDTAGWNEFPAMQSLFIKLSHLILLVYDVTSPSWRKTLSDTIKQIRAVKGDADIFAVGNKCDSLTIENDYSAILVHNIISDQRLVGHVCASARTELGVEGLKQMMLFSRSELTQGHYTVADTIPKRKKLKHSSGGILMKLAHFIKSKRSSSELLTNIPSADHPTTQNQTMAASKCLSTLRGTHHTEYGDLSLVHHADPPRMFKERARTHQNSRRHRLNLDRTTGDRRASWDSLGVDISVRHHHRRSHSMDLCENNPVLSSDSSICSSNDGQSTSSGNSCPRHSSIEYLHDRLYNVKISTSPDTEFSKKTNTLTSHHLLSHDNDTLPRRYLNDEDILSYCKDRRGSEGSHSLKHYKQQHPLKQTAWSSIDRS